MCAYSDRTRRPQLAAATNPASPKHWLKRRFTPPARERKWVTITENRFLPQDYRDRLASFGDGVHAQRLAQGLWVVAEGTIWTLPESQVREPEQSVWKRVVAGIDWGYVHAFACEVVAESGSGRRATVDEVYSRGRLLGEIIPDLLDLQERHDIEVFFADPSEPAYIEHCRRAGLRITEATNDVLPGIDAVAASLKAGETVSPRCTGLLAANGHGQADSHGNGHGQAGNDGVEDAAVQAPPGAAAAGDGHGKGGVKHAAMQACKKGGWRELQREDGTRFSNQGRCVSYAVHSGVLVPVVPVVTISFAVSADTISCDASATLDDFDPATAYLGTLLVDAVAVPAVAITTDALGDAVVPLGTFTPPISPLPPTTLSLTVGGVPSGDVIVACSSVRDVSFVPVV